MGDEPLRAASAGEFDQREDFRAFGSSPSRRASSACNPKVRPTYVALILRNLDD